MNKSYDIIVIGAGHAGCEAALAAARMGASTLLITISIQNIALMPCNPAIGGIGKGNLVCDLDALGGEMARNIDETGIQFRILNRRKGPAVWSSRAQADKYLYKERFQQVLFDTPSLDIKEAIVSEILTESGEVSGVLTITGEEVKARKVLITAGTFIAGEIYIGNAKVSAGRILEPAAFDLSKSLKKLGFNPLRLKTDTPARIHIDSINFNGLEVYESDEEMTPFSVDTNEIKLPQIKCYGTFTNEYTHEIVREGAKESFFYNGSKEEVNGPRYCPSIEDKVIKFKDKTSHKLVIEPEGLSTKEVHINGFSCSIPVEYQIRAYRTVKGLEKCKFIRPAYAIEYDAYNPTGLKPTYETKLIKGLYLAGQVNGTSGYEEAATQGFMAGVNAALSINGKGPFILERNESYIGVLTNDLITKGVTEPYRMFNSRSEYRLLTRQDNAEDRLIEYGYSFGLISQSRFERFKKDLQLLDEIKDILNKTTLKLNNPSIKDFLSNKSISLSQNIRAIEILKRPELNFADLDILLTMQEIPHPKLSKRLANKVEIDIKYAGYIENALLELQSEKSDDLEIPDNFSYDNISGLRIEYAEKLSAIRPKKLSDALRIPGISKAATMLLAVEIKKRNKEY